MIDTDRITYSSSQIRRVKTRLAVRCQICSHRGTVETYLDTPPRLVCSSCGNRNPVIVSRDRSQQWANQRRGK